MNRNLHDFIKTEGSKKGIINPPEEINKAVTSNKPESSLKANVKLKNCSFINKTIVNELLGQFEIEDIESGVINYYTHKKGFNVKNKFINQILEKDRQKKVYGYFIKLNLDINLSDIERLFELLIPPDDKRINGAVYTPPFIVDYITLNTVHNLGKVCDCSCGAGAFLLGALRRLKQISDISIIRLIENYIYGVDVTELSVRRAKVILILFAIENKEDREEIRTNIKCADSLEADWKNLFPKIHSEGGFDYVVGNPPYVRIQDLNSKLKRTLMDKWHTIGTGNFNLYFAFFELGMNILNKEGKLGYITPNNYFTSLAGIQLRQYFYQTKQITKILNFNHLKIFENAQTYTCITLMEKNCLKDYFEYYYLGGLKELSKLDVIKFSRYYFDWLDNKKWRLMSEQDYHNIKKIESSGTPLNKLYPIRVGIATLKDTIYFVEDYGDSALCKVEYNGKRYNIEKSITRKVVKISAINHENEILNDKRRIIFPYQLIDGKYEIIDEKELRDKYPLCYSYLLDVKEELKTRDKGKKSYPAWFAWGRTQGMNYKGDRLYTRTFYYKPDFMLDPSKDSLFCNGYAVFCKNRKKAIQKILNSEVMNYYVKKTSVEIEGNYQCYQKNFIEKFNIPDLTEEEWLYLEQELDKEKIDRWLIGKYKLQLDNVIK